MKDIEWIFFDMGYTLVNEDAAHERRITIALERMAELGVHDVTREQFWRAARDFGSQGRAPFPAAARHFGLKKMPHYINDGEVAYPDAREALWRLRARFKLGIIANQPLGSAHRLTLYGLGDCFDALFPSEEVGIEKPDTGLYLAALRGVGCEPSHALMVGDRPDNDIVPAHEVGMRTARILRGFYSGMADLTPPDVTVSSLDELAAYFHC